MCLFTLLHINLTYRYLVTLVFNNVTIIDTYWTAAIFHYKLHDLKCMISGTYLFNILFYSILV